MLKQLIIAHNSLDIRTWESIETDNIVKALIQRYDVFPENARLYHGNVSQSNDVTPRSEEDVAALADMPGPFYAVNFAGDPLTLLAVVAVALIAVVVVSALKPKIPNVTTRNVQSQSPNNALSARTNSIRINGRIPDIFGTVRSTPDLIAVPYSVFENNIECEYTYMCIGRGSYEIDPITVRDGTTPVSNIEGESVEIFDSNTSPNTGDAPQIRIGDPITRRVISALRSKSVNGQTLLADNEAVDGALNPTSMLFNFRFPHIIYFNAGAPGAVALNTLLTVGGQVTVMTSSVANYRRPYNLSAYVDDIPSGIFGAVLELVPGGVHGPGAVVLGDGANSDVTLTERVRFRSDGVVEYQTVNDIGSPNRPFNHQGYAYIQITMPNVSVSGHVLNFSGKYVASAVDSNKISLNSPVLTTGDWETMTGLASGTVSPWVDVKFFLPLYPLVNMSGVYTVAELTGNTINLTDEAYRLNNDWIWLQHMPAYPGNPTTQWIIDRHAFIYEGAVGFGNWVGPFILDVTTTTEIIANYVALQGLYKDNGTAQTAADVDVQLGVTPCTIDGTALGPEQFFSQTLHGSALERGSIGYTLYADLPEPGRYMVRSRRVTPKDLDFDGQISDEVKWRDVYSSSPVGNIAFGDITTLHCLTHATQQALAVSERQINLLVTRKVNLRISGDTFTTTLSPTNNAAEIISFICLDPKLGNRKKAEVNFDNIYSTVAEAKFYFRNKLAQEFSYTIDSDNLSFEETLQIVANAIFCNAHRRGNVIELVFEGKTDDSRLLFNHRNKVPGSESRTVTFGNVDDNDGIEYEYVSPIDDAILTLYVPADRSAIKPRKVESVGIRSYPQAYWHAYREFNKLQYQNTAIEFEATQEGDLATVGGRILIADNTRPDTQDGEIEAQDGLLITLSQPAVLKDGVDYIISLQLSSGYVQNIPITSGGDPYSAVLATPPVEDLVTDDAAIVKTQYIIIRAENGPNLAALLTSKDHGGFTSKLQCINYDERYYRNDFNIPEELNVQWEDQQLPFSTVWNTVAWSQDLSLFCAIANSAQCATSPDGVTWTARNLPSYQSWNWIAWASELSLFLAVTHTGNASATSPDGITWTARTLPVYTQWGRFAWNGSYFALLEQNNYGSSNRVLTSSDAVNWTIHNAALPAAVSWDGVVWAPELQLWCCINGLPSSMAATSPDGITWTVRTLPGNHYWTSVCWNGFMFVVSCYDEGGTSLYATSFDGVTFTPRTLPLTGRWDNVIWAPERQEFCMIGYGGNALLSPDGINWTLSPMDSESNWAGVCWGNGPRTFIATSVSNTATANRLDFF